MDTPPMTASEIHSHATWTALLWAISYPGRPRQLPAQDLHAFQAIAEALIDLETSYYVAMPELEAILARTGGRARPAAEALYQFYPVLSPEALATVQAAPVGSYLYPDESATLVIGCTLGDGAV